MKCSESNKNDEFIDFKLSRGDDGRICVGIVYKETDK